LAKVSDPIDGEDPSGLRYADLPHGLRLKFDTYSLDVIVLSDTDDEEVREMFLRLQNGTTLKAQEKRNAMPGKMRDIVKSLAAHPFFGTCGFTNARLNFDLLAAQMTAIELNGGPCHLRNSNLNKMYVDQMNFDESSPKAKKIRRVLEYFATAFPEKTPELERFSVLSLYGLVSHCLEKYVMQNRHHDLRNWFLNFKCEWDVWEADHRIPWAQGGKTTVSNGQVACLACNSAKGGLPAAG
jgi:hypothetical protein